VSGAAPAPFEELERILEAACGLALSPGIRSSLADAYRRAAREEGVDEAAFLERLREGDARSVHVLVEAAVVGETYFFRHPEQLGVIGRLLFEAAPRDAPLAIWSAGCATGEEPYSLAMALADAGRGDAEDRIVATDVSARALAAAAQATYGEWSLRRLDGVVRARHFSPRAGRLEVRPELRRRVDFRRHNLVHDPAPGGSFDLVICRNVLIYFTPRTAAAVAAKLAGAVRPGGLLALGPVETPIAADLGLERVEVDGIVLHRVAPAGAARPAVAPAARPAASPPRRAPRRVAAPAPPPPAPALPEAPATTPAPVATLPAARDAASRGDVIFAEALAREVASRELCPEAWLLVAIAAESRGDLPGAVDAARRALYLEPSLAVGHAALVPLYARLGLPEDAARARRNALEVIAHLDDAAPLRGVEIITAGALRSALSAETAPGRSSHGWTGTIGWGGEGGG
jgi:chemotaxis protein methyltransferase CheR